MSNRNGPKFILLAFRVRCDAKLFYMLANLKAGEEIESSEPAT